MSLKVQKTEATPQTKHAKRYDEGERLQLLDQYQTLRNEGKNAAVAAKETGVPYITMRTWQRAIEALKAPKGKLSLARGAKAKKPSKRKKTRSVKPQKAKRGRRPRKAAKTPERSPVVVTMANGTRVECPTVESAAQVLKAIQRL